MQTVLYTDVITKLKALTGIEDFNGTEDNFLDTLAEKRIRSAYDESWLWPRYIRQEERTGTIENILAWDETGKDSVDTFIAVYDVDPRKRLNAIRYEFTTDFEGAKVLGKADTDPVDDLPTYFVVYKAQITYTDFTTNVPVEFAQYVIHGTYADWLRLEGQNEKAAVEEQFATIELQRQLEKISYTQGSPKLWQNISSHSNRQSRWGTYYGR